MPRARQTPPPAERHRFSPMTKRIEPALTPEEWEVPHAQRARFYGCADARAGHLTLADGTPNPLTGVGVDVANVPALIALANATLPDSDPRKITREKIAAMRQSASEV